MRRGPIEVGGGKVVVVLLCSIIMVTCFPPLNPSPANAQPAVVLSVGKPLLVNVGDWRFLNVTLQDYYEGMTSMVVFSVWKNAAGQTVAVETCGIAMTGGEEGYCYSPVFNIGSGTYDVFVFVISVPYDNPLSLTLTTQVSV